MSKSRKSSIFGLNPRQRRLLSTIGDVTENDVTALIAKRSDIIPEESDVVSNNDRKLLSLKQTNDGNGKIILILFFFYHTRRKFNCMYWRTPPISNISFWQRNKKNNGQTDDVIDAERDISWQSIFACTRVNHSETNEWFLSTTHEYRQWEAVNGL